MRFFSNDFYAAVNCFHSISRLHSIAIRFHSLAAAASAVHQFCSFVTLLLAHAISFAAASIRLFRPLSGYSQRPHVLFERFWSRADTVDKFLLPPRSRSLAFVLLLILFIAAGFCFHLSHALRSLKQFFAFLTILFRFVISILCAHCWATKIYILFACHKRDFIVGIYRSCMYNFLLTLFFSTKIFCYWVIEKNVYKVKSRTVGFGRKMWTCWTWHINMNGFFLLFDFRIVQDFAELSSF